MDNGFGITTTGYNKKSFLDLKSDLENNLRSSDLFGADIDFSDQDPLYQFSVPILEMVAELWELAEQVFYSASPKYAEGLPLRNTGKYIGISGKQAHKSGTLERFTGTPGTPITTGFKVKTTTNIFYETLESKLISQSGYIDINIAAVNPGKDGDTPAGTITIIVTPIIGLDSVTNPNASIGGQDQESDIGFRDRYQSSTAIGAGSTVDAIHANILTVTGVTDATVVENDEITTVNGIPPKSIYALVNGGADLDVANAIFTKKPGGIGSFGTTTINVIDSQGVTHAMNFSRPIQVSVWIKIDATTDSNFPAEGNTQIINAVKAYIDGIKLGEDIIIYKIITTISNLKLNGLLDMLVTLSTDGITYNSSNIAIDPDKIAVTTVDKIGVI